MRERIAEPLVDGEKQHLLVVASLRGTGSCSLAKCGRLAVPWMEVREPLTTRTQTPPHSHPPPSTHEHPVHWLLLLLRVAAQGAGRGCVRYLRSGMLGEPPDWQSTASSPIFQLRRKAMFTGTENLLLRTL